MFTSSSERSQHADFEVVLTTKQLGGLVMPSLTLHRLKDWDVSRAREFAATLAREHAQRLPAVVAAVERVNDDQWEFTTNNATLVIYTCKRVAAS